MSMGRVSSNGVKERIGQLCSEFKLPTVGAEAGPRFTAAGHTDALHTLVEVLEQEAEDRRQRRIIRIRRASRLPVGKTWDTFEHDRVPVALRQQLDELADGSFVERGVNVLAFGLPGTGKTHAMCAIGHIRLRIHLSTSEANPESTEGGPSGQRPEVSRRCSCASGIMVLKHETHPRKGAPNRCYHATTPTASVSPSTITA